MRHLYQALLVCILITGSIVMPTFADDPAPLFINLTTDDPHRARMGIMFGKNQFERGHPLTIFLNDRAVFVGSSANAERFAQHQQVLTELVNTGATVIVCPMCQQHYGVKEDDLLPGLQLGNPELTGGALFTSGTQTLTW
jgi:sulfur relay (sulfurtransferase) complex TusBCD TusD component (DsrE family)